MISANNITLRVGKKALFEDVNIKFTEGNCYGLIGANGAGKSTFLKILSGQLEPTKGDIVITPGQRLSFLQQDHFKYDAYPVLDTVIMGNERLYQIMKEKEAIYAKEDFTDEDGIRASELEGEFAEMNGWEAESDAATLLNGIQKAIYNTVYQLMAVKKKHPEYLEQAETLLHVPDYFHFLLTGEKTCEYTEATTGQLVCPTTKDWDYELIDMLGYPRKIFQKLIMPSTSIGHLTDAVKEAVGFDLEVVAPATHDTGSAVLAVPANDDDFIYISSGTWSLMGIERKEADCSEKSCEMNFTNEGGYAGRFRYLKNIMGLWMIQSVRHEFDDAYSFAQICEMAEEAKDFPSRVNANDECFLSPENMTKEVQDYCRRTGQQVPETLGEIATVIYTSLADCYAKIAKEIEEMTGRTYSRIHIVGGGSNAGYLNELTAKATKKEIHAGPGEATAIGNITAQMLKAEEFKTIEEARTTIHESFGIKVYKA